MNIKSTSYFSRLRQHTSVDAMPPSLEELGKDEAVTTLKSAFVVAYLVLKNTGTDYVGTLAELFAAEHAAFEYHVASNPLFFKFEEALQYLRFMGDNQIILKAVIPQMAVEGQFETLHVRAELLKVKHIYGGYTSVEANHFVINPSFDSSILPLIKTHTTYDE